MYKIILQHYECDETDTVVTYKSERLGTVIWGAYRRIFLGDSAAAVRCFLADICEGLLDELLEQVDGDHPHEDWETQAKLVCQILTKLEAAGTIRFRERVKQCEWIIADYNR